MRRALRGLDPERGVAALAGEEDRYTVAVRDGRETTERVLRAEMARIAAEEDLEDAPQLAEPERVEEDA